MTGLEKITDRIRNDAKKDAEAILAEATAECEKIKAAYAVKIREMKEKLNEDAAKEAESVVVRAKSSAEMAKRNLLLSKRSDMIDAVIEAAHRDVLEQSEEKYDKLLKAMLRTMIRNRIKAEKESIEQYGEDISAEKYEVIFNKEDREKFGAGVVAFVANELVGQMPASMTGKLCLSADCADIDGGMILRCGDIETNCEISMIVEQYRDEFAALANDILFTEKEDRAKASL